MSKRHQTNRRKTYGRRQHDLAERRGRDDQPDSGKPGFDVLDAGASADRLGFLDPGALRFHFAMGD